MADMDKEQQKAAQARESALKNALGQIERQFGQGSIMKMGEEAAQVRVDAIPTGALSLDLALGVGGLPRGRIVEVFGPESSGKTTLVYHVLASAQKLGGICAFIDAEHAMDPAYAKRIGVDVDELLVSQPDHGEQALEIADMLIRSGAVDIVAIDSVAALTPKAELEGAMGDQTVGLQARMMSQAMRKLAGNLNRANTLCLLTNQIREKVGVMFGSPETQPGGRALKFYASQRLDIRRIETLKEGTEAVGNRVRVKVVKNKVAAPFRQAEFDIEYGVGISSQGCILDLGIEHGIVQKSGSFFSYGDERMGQGRNNVKGYLREHPEIADEIERKIYEAVGAEPASAPLAAVPPPRGARARRRRSPPPSPPPRSKRPRRGGRRSWTTERSWTTWRRERERAHPAGLSRRRPPRAHRRRAAHLPRAQAGGARGDRGRGGRAAPRPACSTTRATRGASPRTSASSTAGAPSGSRASCSAAASPPDADRGRRGRPQPRGRAGARRCCCSSSACRPPRDDRERDRAWRLLVRRGYERGARLRGGPAPRARAGAEQSGRPDTGCQLHPDAGATLM